MTDPNCLFCRIVSGEIPARIIHEDETTIAFLDINPWQVGHALVIPRRHVADVLTDDLVLAELGPTVARVIALGSGRPFARASSSQAVNWAVGSAATWSSSRLPCS